ncbi:MAG: hypothetical protein JW757_11185 [Anaerolineales bacterium]|nr:hypothetical protein [Anaerolineales bacterium]
MFFERKTKDKNQWQFIIYPIGVMGIFFGIGSFFGLPAAFYVLGGVFILISSISFITFWRTQNVGFLVVALFQVSVGLLCISAPPAFDDKSQLGLTPVFIVTTYASMIAVFYLAINRRLKWRGQEVFELAALPVEDTGNNYTARPRPAGQTEVSRTEMIRFVNFITSNLIAFVFREENRFVFVLPLPGDDWPYLLGLKKNYLDDTWVAIDFDGNVSVNITEEDYLLFKQDLNFDQVCESLGNVFIEFLELSKAGKESQIIDRMNALRLFPLG